MNSCKAPVTGITIDPNGLITLCCNFNNGFETNINRTLPLTYVKDVDDLAEYFAKEYQLFNYINKTHGWEAIPECSECVVQKIKKVPTTKKWYDDLFDKPYEYYDNNLKIRLLEVTSSNICNQMCATCAPYFSSKWVKNVHKLWPTRPHWNEKTRFLTKQDVDKIVKIIPQLEVLMLKGGEPFADQNNLKFLRAVLSADRPVKIIIVSNMHEISNAFLDTIDQLKKEGHTVGISASIDATGDLYDWVRDGPWEKTRDTCAKLWNEVGIKVDINSTVSCFTFPYLNEIYDELKQYDWATRVNMRNVVRDPDYCSPGVFRQEYIDEVISNCKVPKWDSMKITTLKYRDGIAKKTLDYINKFDNVRSKKFFEIKPEFEKYLA